MIQTAGHSGLALWRDPAPTHVGPPRLRLPPAAIAGWALALALVVLIEGRHAAADLIDQYLPTAISGLDLAPGVTVNSRVRPDYDPLGIRLGNFIVRPTASESVGFDSNPTASTHGHGSALLETAASIDAESDWSRDQLGLTVTVDDKRYPSTPQVNATDWTAATGGGIDVGEDRISWSAAHLSLNQSPQDIDNGGAKRSVPFNINDIRVNYTANVNRLSITPALDFQTSRFAADIPEVSSQAYRNRNVLDGSLTLRYALAPQTNLVFVARGTGIGYLTSLPGQARRNSTGFAFLGGMEWGGGTWDARLLAGYQQRDYDSRQYAQIAAPVVQGSMSWTPVGDLTLTGRLSRTIQDASDESVAAYTTTEADALVDYELRRNVLLHGQGTVQVANFSQGGGTTTQYSGRIGATWLLRRDVSLDGSYSFLDNLSSQNGNYTDSIALLRLGLKL